MGLDLNQMISKKGKSLKTKINQFEINSNTEDRYKGNTPYHIPPANPLHLIKRLLFRKIIGLANTIKVIQAEGGRQIISDTLSSKTN
jgi:hypothetical protein